MTENNRKDAGVEKAISIVSKLVSIAFGVFKEAWSAFPKRFWEAYFMLAGVGVCAYACGFYGKHLDILRWFFPNALDGHVLKMLRSIPPMWHSFGCLFGFICAVVMFFGARGFAEKRDLQNSLDLMGFQNGKGRSPKIIRVLQHDDFRKQIVVSSIGIGLERYESKRSDIEACFRKSIEKIENGTDPSIVIITVSTRKLPDKCYYSELISSVNQPYSFIIGASRTGVETKCIRELPHMLIAGTTGGGKSVYFKQALLSMLEKSERIQMYLLDLKGGLEMADFKDLPMVRVAKDESQALSYLTKINAEMKERFAYLEEKGLKEIDPERDKKDIIIVGVDEASVLYGVGSGGSSRNYTAFQARDLTDKLAKLSRAAGIHLILATQKVTVASIDTQVQENVLGRMVFRMNTLQGSMTVLGNKMAMELPEIKGRGIWTSGNKFIQVQAPYMEQEELEDRTKNVKSMWAAGKRSNFQPMLEVDKKAEMKAAA